MQSENPPVAKTGTIPEMMESAPYGKHAFLREPTGGVLIVNVNQQLQVVLGLCEPTRFPTCDFLKNGLPWVVFDTYTVRSFSNIPRALCGLSSENS